MANGGNGLDLCVVLLGALKVDSCPARIALGPGLGVKAPYFPHQLAEQTDPCAGHGPRESPVQSQKPTQKKIKRPTWAEALQRELAAPCLAHPDQTLASHAAFSAQFSPAPREPRFCLGTHEWVRGQVLSLLGLSHS